MNLWEALLNLIFPPREECPLCGVYSKGAEICTSCRDWLAAKRQDLFCFVCGRPITNGELCSDCIAKERPFAYARSVGPYEGPIRQAVHRLKYCGRQHLAEPLGQLMVQRVINNYVYRRADLAVPVPMTAKKLRRRGFNQALLLARVVAAGLNIPLQDILQKTQETEAQAGLNRHQRERNLQNAFILQNNAVLRGKTVLLIDDVITTCSTVSAAAEALRQGNPAEILVLTFAATPKNKKLRQKYRFNQPKTDKKSAPPKSYPH